MSDLFGNHIVGFPTRRLIYGKNFTKITPGTGKTIFSFFFKIWWTDFNKTWYVASGTPVHHSLYKSLPWVGLELIYGKLKCSLIGFCNGKRHKHWIFSENFEVCDLKLDKNRQFIELMKLCERSRSRHYMTNKTT